MKRQIDLLLGGILLAVPMGLIPSARSTSLSFPSGRPSAFPESYLLTQAQFPVLPEPEAYQNLGRLGMLVVGDYRVRPADTLQGIAKRFGTSADFLRSTNGLNSVYLSPGRKIKVHNGLGMLHQVREVRGKPESLQDVARRYGKPAAVIAKANRLPGAALLDEAWLSPGTILSIPQARLRFTDYLLPVDWTRGKRLISSGFGYRRHPILRYRAFHSGLDLPRPFGSQVKASRDGVVVFADWRGGYGRLIIVRHQGGTRTWYGHLSQIRVTPGQRVRAGQLIGNVGSTGLSTGPHLHFEVRDRYGNTRNPSNFLF